MNRDGVRIPISWAASAPGLVGPSMLPTIAFRNLMQVGYGINVLAIPGGSVFFLTNASLARGWAVLVLACSVCAVAGVWATHARRDTRLELVSTIAVLTTYFGSMTAAVLCFLFQIGPNGLLPIWWPAALAAQSWWRIRAIVKQQAAEEAAARRNRTTKL